MMPRTVAAVFAEEAAGKEENQDARIRLLRLRVILLAQPASNPSINPAKAAKK